MTIDVPYDSNAAHSYRRQPDVAKVEASARPENAATGRAWALCITPGPNQVLLRIRTHIPGRVL